MKGDINLIYDTVKILLARYKGFGENLASLQFEYKTDLKYHTAATDGKKIYIDPDYFASLTEEERVFLIAHEVMHTKFLHMFRLTDKEKQKKDMDVWNEACDAIINANLQRDGLTIKEGYVDRPEALAYTSEEFYKILLQEKKQNNHGSKSGEFSASDHSMWEEAFEKMQSSSKGSSNNESKEASELKNLPSDIDERKDFEQNRIQRRQEAKEKMEKQKEELLRNSQKSTPSTLVSLGDIGESKEEIPWEFLLRKEIEKTEVIWNNRRSIAENNYAYRLEENDMEEEAQTEVMIDVSGSVSLDLVKAFLRAIKPILRSSKLKVGCFNEKFWGMNEIKTVGDIDNFKIPQEALGSAAWTEDWDLAVRSFSKKREVNKIIFTDGWPCPGTMPKEDLKNENIIWVVYGNKNFKPCCGKVIHITEAQLEKLSLKQTSYVDEEQIFKYKSVS